MFKNYYELTKPGIVYGNVLTALAAYFYASHWQIHWLNFLATIAGIAFVIASACVFNNYLDRDIDAKMERTKDRALASGAMSNEMAVLFGCILCLFGFVLLICFVNILTSTVALIGFLVYVFAYTFLNRTTLWATEIGSIAGATPIVVGYTAVTDKLDLTALILFLILVFWQMPHFYAIAVRRSGEYAAADIPVLPLQKGMQETKRRMLLYVFLFALAVAALTFFGYAGFVYLTVMEIAALIWFWRCGEWYDAQDQATWAFRSFIVSLVALVVFCIMLSLAPFLP
jgi:protoheme IX farnesyltransferase